MGDGQDREHEMATGLAIKTEDGSSQPPPNIYCPFLLVPFSPDPFKCLPCVRSWGWPGTAAQRKKGACSLGWSADSSCNLRSSETFFIYTLLHALPFFATPVLWPSSPTIYMHGAKAADSAEKEGAEGADEAT